MTIAGVQIPAKDDREEFSISEMCAEFGVTARALRFYEDEGLISPRRQGLARIYSHRDRARLAWILRGKRVGFSLADIREMIDLYDVGDDRRSSVKSPCRSAGSGRFPERAEAGHRRSGDGITDFIAMLDGSANSRRMTSGAANGPLGERHAQLYPAGRRYTLRA